MALAVDPIVIARELLRCQSVTPVEGGALAFLEACSSKAASPFIA